MEAVTVMSGAIDVAFTEIELRDIDATYTAKLENELRILAQLEELLADPTLRELSDTESNIRVRIKARQDRIRIYARIVAEARG